jgi:sporulation-control protein spo0M
VGIIRVQTSYTNKRIGIAMLKRFKKVLGIEGARIELLVDERYAKSSLKIKGKINITSLSGQVINSIHIKLLEKYKRGRKKNILIDEYVIGELILPERIEIAKDEMKEIDFTLEFIDGESPMDFLEKKNFFYKGIVKAAKFVKGVNSTYRVEATADVKGTKLDPVDSKPIKLI